MKRMLEDEKYTILNDFAAALLRPDSSGNYASRNIRRFMTKGRDVDRIISDIQGIVENCRISNYLSEILSQFTPDDYRASLSAARRQLITQ